MKLYDDMKPSKSDLKSYANDMKLYNDMKPYTNDTKSYDDMRPYEKDTRNGFYKLGRLTQMADQSN